LEPWKINSGNETAYTSRQGQFLAFIYHYTTLHERPPAEAEMARFFQVTPPSVHSTILTLERRALITRAPGQARSIALRLPPLELLPLYGSYATANIPPPACQDDGQQPSDTGAALLRLIYALMLGMLVATLAA
jgi:SOS-response transcriptional repressor LexA